MPAIPIVLACDENYAAYMYVTVFSLLKNKSEETIYDIYCLVDSSLKDSTKQYFFDLKKNFKNVNINFINMKDSFSKNKMQISHITTPTYYRLLMPKILDYDRVIYLDTDVIVLSDLTELFNTNMNGYYIAGVKAAMFILEEWNRQYYAENGLYDLSKYINAGVTLWNLEEIRKSNLESLIQDLVDRNLLLMDQDVINIAFQNKIKNLDLKYNFMTKYNFSKSIWNKKYDNYVSIYGKDEINEAIKQPIIVHYADKKKPWDKIPISTSLTLNWWKYAKLTPFYRQFLYKMVVILLKRLKTFSIMIEEKTEKRLIIIFFGVKLSLRIK